MPQNRDLTFQRLNEIWKSNDYPILELQGNKYIMLSDLHLGNGKNADDFHDNKETLLAALKLYKEAGYKLILIGDIEDLWQFTVPEVKHEYQDSVYQAMRNFGDENTYRIFGNHDGDWGIQPDPVKTAPFRPLLPAEAIKMKDENGNIKILLVHGHQGSLESDRDSWSSRFAVRFFRLVEPFFKKLGITSHAPAIKCEVVNEYEQIMYAWAKENKTLLICGHSHNAIFASLSYTDRLRAKIQTLEAKIRENPADKEQIKKDKKELADLSKKVKRESKCQRDILPTEVGANPLPCYFNTGCGIYEDGITGIEILDEKIRLAKWHRDPKHPDTPPRYEIYQEESLTEYLRQI